MYIAISQIFSHIKSNNTFQIREFVLQTFKAVDSSLSKRARTLQHRQGAVTTELQRHVLLACLFAFGPCWLILIRESECIALFTPFLSFSMTTLLHWVRAFFYKSENRGLIRVRLKRKLRWGLKYPGQVQNLLSQRLATKTSPATVF